MATDRQSVEGPAEILPAEPSASPTPSAAARRNYTLGVLNGTLGTISFDLLHPELMLAGLIYALTQSPLLVAVVTVISKLAGLLPQLHASSFMEHHASKRPFYVALAVLRGASGIAMLGAMWLFMYRVDGLSLGIFFGAYLVASIMGGLGYVVFLDMIGRMIPARSIGSFFGNRELTGGLLSLVAGWILVQPILDRGGEGRTSAELVTNYLIVAVLGTILSIVSMALLCMCREEPGPRAARPTTLRESFGRGLGWLRTDANYRAYFWLRVAFRINYLSLAFFIPYGVERIPYSADPKGVAVLGGVMIAAIKLSRSLSSAWWGRLADRTGVRPCMIGAGLCFFLGPVVFLVAPHLPPLFSVAIPLTKVVLDLPLTMYFVALIVVGAAIQGDVIGGGRFLVVNAPPARRISYMGFLNTVTSPLTLLPFVGAEVMQHWNVTALYWMILGGGLLYLVSAFGFKNERPEHAAAEEVPVAAE
jgi:MFS family permease